MSSAPWLEIARVKTATVPEWVALDLLRDIDSAIRNRDAGSLRNFAAEAAASGLDQESARAAEIAVLIEGKAGARDEVLRLKAALEPQPPTQAELVRAFDQEQLAAAAARSAPFDVNTFEAVEAERVAEANRQLRERQRRHEEQRAAQIAAAEQPKGPGR